MIIATAGHVDHGKTELVKALTGIDTDRLPEEKKRGLSIDLGFAYQSLPDDISLGFIDVPGHEKFIRNMLAGVGGIDLALLVVASDDGVMPQTREHLAILDLLDIEQYFVAITKIDKVCPDRVTEVRHQIESVFDKNCRMPTKFFSVSAPDNQGIKLLKQALIESAKKIRKRPDDDYFRMPIDRVFSIKGTGLIATGTVISGKVCLEDKDIFTSTGSKIRIRDIHVNNVKSTKACAGDRCAINLTGKGIEQSQLHRGHWLMHSTVSVPTRRIDLDLRVLSSESRPLKHWTPVHAHIATGHCKARIAILSGGSIAVGERGLVQLVVEENTHVVYGDHIILRDESSQRTIAGGHVIDPFSPKRGRARATRLIELNALRHPHPADRLRELSVVSQTGIAVRAFAIANNLKQSRIEALIGVLKLKRVDCEQDEHIFSPDQWQSLLKQILKSVAYYHQQHPGKQNPGLKDIQKMLKPHQQSSILEEAIKTQLTTRELVGNINKFRLAKHQIASSDGENHFLNTVLPYLQPESGTPLSLHQLSEATGVDKNKLTSSLKKLTTSGTLLFIGNNRYLTEAYLVKLSGVVQSICDDSKSGFSVAEFCAQSQLGRNFTIDLMEYFDRRGFTRRTGNTRTVIRPAQSVFSGKKSK